MKKKILFIHHATGWGGAPINIVNIINSLDKVKYQAEVLLIRDSIVSKKLEDLNIPFTVINNTFYKKYYKYYSHTVPRFSKWFRIQSIVYLSISWLLSRYLFAPMVLKNFDVDLIHLNSSVLTDWLAPSKRKAKVVMHIQEPFSNGSFGVRSSFFRSQMRKYANIIITISQDNNNRINIPEKTAVIYNYAEIPKFSPIVDSYSSKRVIYLGGAAQIKGFYTLVKALDYLDKEVKIVFAGNYPLDNKKRSLLKKSLRWALRIGIKQKKAMAIIQQHPQAELVGLLSDIGASIDNSCALISPFSVTHFSRPVIEAHLHRKASIVSDVEGMSEIVEHKKTGLIFPVDNAKQLAEAINYMANHPEEAKAMGDSGYKTALQRFTPKNIKEFINVYESL